MLVTIGRIVKRHQALAASMAVALLVGTISLAALFITTRDAKSRLDEANHKLSSANLALGSTNQQLESANRSLAANSGQITATNQRLTAALERESQATTAAGDNLYTAHINLIQQSWERAEISKVRELLLKQIPKAGEPDRRSFEWYYYWNELHSQYATITGLVGPVESLAYSSDGRWLAIGCSKGEGSGRIYVWDTASTNPPWQIAKLDQIPCALGFAPNSSILAYSAGTKLQPHRVAVSDVVTGTTRNLDGHTQPVLSLAFSPDGSQLATVGIDAKDDASTGYPEATHGLLYFWNRERAGEVLLWNITSETKLTPKIQHGLTNKGVCAVAFQDNQKLLLGTQKGGLALWSLASGVLSEWAGDGSRTPIQAVSVEPTGVTAIFGTGSTPNGGHMSRCRFAEDLITTVQTISAPQGGLLNCLYSPDGEWMAGSSLDRTTTIWRFSNGAYEKYCVIRGHTMPVRALTFSPNGRILATGGWDGEVKLWALARPPGWTDWGTVSHVQNLVCGGKPERVYRGSGGSGEIQCYDPWTLEQQPSLPPGEVFLGADQRVYHRSPVSLTGKVEIRMADQIESEPIAQTLIGVNDARLGVSVSPDRQWIVDIDNRQSALNIRVLAVDSGKVIASKQYKGGFVVSSPRGWGVSPDSTRFVLWNQSNQLCAWSIPNLDEIKSETFDSGVSSFGFSTTSPLLATGHDQGEVRLWNTKRMDLIHTFPSESTLSVFATAFSNDGRILAAGYRDGRLRLIDLATNEARFSTVIAQNSAISDVAFGRDGRSIHFGHYYGSVTMFGQPFAGTTLAEPVPKNIAQTPQYVPGSVTVSDQRWAEWHRDQAMIAMENGNAFAAEFHIRQVSSIPEFATTSDNHAEFQYTLGRSAMASAKTWDEAEKRLRRAIDLESANANSARIYLAQIAAFRDDFDALRALAPKCISHLQETPSRHFSWQTKLIEALAIAPDCATESEWKQLAEIGERLANKISVYETKRAAGLAHLRAGDSARAVARLKEALLARPQSYSTQFATLVALHHAGKLDANWYSSTAKSLDELRKQATSNSQSEWHLIDSYNQRIVIRFANEAKSLYEGKPKNTPAADKPQPPKPPAEE